jgi:uncharacterized damage-inducible protein DinB
MLTDRFREMAAYNRWANQRMYADAAMLDDTVRKRPLGLFFSSIHGTLNHLLVADYIWMRRFTGEGPQPERLSQILYDDFDALRTERIAHDERIVDFIQSCSDFDRVIEYQNSTGRTFQQRLEPALSHFFNHQTHHRGQVHAGMTIVGIKEPRSLDLLGLQRA